MKTWKQLSRLIFACAALAASDGLAQTKTHLQEDFDTTAVGATPAGWKCIGMSDTGYGSVTNNLCVSKANSLALVSTTAGSDTWTCAIVSLKPPIRSDSDIKLIVACKLNFAQTNTRIDLMLTSKDTVPTFCLTFDEKGRIVSTTKDAPFPLGDYSTDVWYDVKIEFVPLKRSYDLTITANGSPVASSKELPAFSKPINNDLLYLRIFGRKNEITRFNVDDVSVTSE